MLEAYQENLLGQPKEINIEEFIPTMQMTDPRPDLKKDSNDWSRLLDFAMEMNKELAGNLHGFRCGGLRLVKDKVGYILRPEFNENSIWSNISEYEKDRDKWLMKYGNQIILLLDMLGDLHQLDDDEELPF